MSGRPLSLHSYVRLPQNWFGKLLLDVNLDPWIPGSAAYKPIQEAGVSRSKFGKLQIGL